MGRQKIKKAKARDDNKRPTDMAWRCIVWLQMLLFARLPACMITDIAGGTVNTGSENEMREFSSLWTFGPHHTSSRRSPLATSSVPQSCVQACSYNIQGSDHSATELSARPNSISRLDTPTAIGWPRSATSRPSYVSIHSLNELSAIPHPQFGTVCHNIW